MPFVHILVCVSVVFTKNHKKTDQSSRPMEESSGKSRRFIPTESANTSLFAVITGIDEEVSSTKFHMRVKTIYAVISLFEFWP